jgi:hypothetical protein
MRRLSCALLILLPLGLGVPACGGDDGTGPKFDPDPDPTGDPAALENLPGSYTATTLTVDFGDGPVDMLSGGASVLLTLTGDGATSGTIFAPGGGDGGEDVSAPLDGTWAYASPILTLDHPADTFLRDMPLTATDSGGTIHLWGEETFGGETVRLILTRVP